MYRVELKGWAWFSFFIAIPPVPNVPCGVESYSDCVVRLIFVEFLMYRVELKAEKVGEQGILLSVKFLMYRVELKDRKKSGYSRGSCESS